jgi:hypothetical protein
VTGEGSEVLAGGKVFGRPEERLQFSRYCRRCDEINAREWDGSTAYRQHVMLAAAPL